MINHLLAFELLSNFSLNKLELLFSNDSVMIERIRIEKFKRSSLKIGPITQLIANTSSFGSLL